MARPLKSGLDYFPLDTDFFNDDKILFVSARFDEKGEIIAAKLLCRIYRNGYYLIWNDDTALLFAKAAGKNITTGLVNDVVHELIKRDFFNKDLFMRFGVLTSNGIQKRYFEAIGRRKEIEIWKDVLLIEQNLINANISFINVNNNSENASNNSQSKVKEIKVNESKVNTTREASIEIDFIEKFNSIKNSKFKITSKVKSSLAARIKDGYTLEQITAAIENCKSDQYHKDNPQYLTPEFILRSDKLEKYLNYQKKIIVDHKTVNQNATAEDYLRAN